MSRYDRKLGDERSPDKSLSVQENGDVVVWGDSQSVRLTRDDVVVMVTQLIQEGVFRVEDLPQAYHCYSCDANTCPGPTHAEEQEAAAKRKPYREAPR